MTQNNETPEGAETNGNSRPLDALARQLWETFDRRAAHWQREGALGDVVAQELRTVNDEWLELVERTQPLK